MKYLNQYRVRWWTSAFFQILLFAAAYLPTVTLVGTQSSAFGLDKVSQSALWYLSNAGFPIIYNVILILYAVLSLPLIIFGFNRELKRVFIMIAAVTDMVYMLLHSLLTVFIYDLGATGDFAILTTFTIWFWVYLLVQTLQIVHLFMLYIQIKKARV